MKKSIYLTNIISVVTVLALFGLARDVHVDTNTNSTNPQIDSSVKADTISANQNKILDIKKMLVFFKVY
ncbi:hypothetical protein [Pediococcus argentinicus]|uniref:hypothetical protein n=1 Tax=Pediococcus argentinicus TaxID=480391 RepID=UPI000ABB4454|nr:hypothetical protein [Pediococcus argentinicus]GEP20387.1 hypothetical protein LSA03_17710 [Pediococcus argentinicus]